MIEDSGQQNQLTPSICGPEMAPHYYVARLETSGMVIMMSVRWTTREDDRKNPDLCPMLIN